MVFETTILPVFARNKQMTLCVELTLETSHHFIYKSLLQGVKETLIRKCDLS